MRLHRFFIDKRIEGREITVTEERLINQWKNVFRYKIGDRVLIFDGNGKEFLGEILGIMNHEVRIMVLETKEGKMPEKRIILCQSLIKKDNMEWVVEKATELGVSKIIPILSERSEKKGFNIERARKIAIEASEQCGRADVPEIGEVMNLESGIMNYAKDAAVFDSSGKSFHNSYFMPHISNIFIGPEGGWTEKEMERFSHYAKASRDKKEAKTEIFSLGKFTLRAETAAVVALARFLT